jgi:hypothetical protein
MELVGILEKMLLALHGLNHKVVILIVFRDRTDDKLSLFTSSAYLVCWIFLVCGRALG